MIPTKMLVYRGTDGGTQTIANTRRRKKSTGELFQKGYRVRMGHGQVSEKEDQDSICYNFGSCVHVISYWGKTCVNVLARGESPIKQKAGVSRTLWTQLEQVQVQDFLCIMIPIWQTLEMKKKSFGKAHQGSRHLVKDYLFNFFCS